jgi:hypothetical protein
VHEWVYFTSGASGGDFLLLALVIIKELDYSRDVPTVLRIGGFRFFFFSNEGLEPAHVHVEHQDATAKFWLDPVSLASSYGFNAAMLNKILALVRANQTLFLESWNEYFTN